jgi:hypothetical protein
MHHGTRTLTARPLRRRARTLAAVAGAVLVVSALSAAAATAESPSTVWLCKPGLASNPCLSDQTATVQLANGGSFVQHARPAGDPAVDCFYVYPTVSSEFTFNADLTIGAEEEQIAINQASRFSQACQVYAPMYPQLTLLAITFGLVTPETAAIAYNGMLSAWKDYLANYNHGRGIVLIGHSQGSALLIQLLKEQIDPNPALRHQIVSAIVPGANVIVPSGQVVGGSFQHVPACRFAWQTHCVVAYSSFLKEPPNPSYFGRVKSALFNPTGVVPGVTNPQVLCVNPTLLFQGPHAGPLLPYTSTGGPFPGFLAPYVQVGKAPTPWVADPRQYSAQCEQVNGASWLQVTNVGPAGDPREQVKETISPLWGTHLADINLALGNLVRMVSFQARVYEWENRSGEDSQD